MYKEILKLLKCPKCNGELSLTVENEEDCEVVEGKLSCKGGHDWVIREGIINFGSVEQELANNWTESYEQYNDEDMEKKLSEVPQNQIIIGDKAKKFVIDNISHKKSEFILDIATGRGALFREMVKHLKAESQIICADLSFIVLKYDRIRAKKTNPEAKVNYIACDATNLPFKDNTVDTAVSFCGIQNMLNMAAAGMKEANRVLKAGQSLLDSYVVINEDSKGFKMLKEFCKDNKIIGAEEFTIKTGIRKAYAQANFDNIDIITIGESIGEKNDLDLLPFEGEWFAMVVVECIK
ncbi:class I SAM-dependent methyltransferase [Clostridium swellfunianum]|uniref:class I SAM-dependent methyltransferase n=1 Tax=Clostridium swellfunianum TaxID=1367462 RepID=UPI00202E131F|nr:class I SAM-dependent methyltransferase [Clostridium swellfunianum]MCM0650262.1 class I SAM-dependent methyltransferase [Clostridium swellfunianum]